MILQSTTIEEIGSGVNEIRRHNHSAVSYRGFEFDEFAQLSERIDRDPLLTQGSCGNASIKLGNRLWMKISGRGLANAMREDIFLPLNLSETRKRILRQFHGNATAGVCFNSDFEPSVETVLHAILPHRVVVHVPSVNTLAHAVRSDAQEILGRRLRGVRWRWIPYAPSALSLAGKVKELIASSPDFDVLVLGNRGLVVCGDDCETVERLLKQMEHRMKIVPRRVPECDTDFLLRLVRGSRWRLAENARLHCLATDSVSRSLLAGGNLYPRQALLLGGSAPWTSFYSGLYSEASRHPENRSGGRAFLIVRDKGVLLSNEISSEKLDALAGLAEVIQRIEVDAPVRYLTADHCGVMPPPNAQRAFVEQGHVAVSA